MFGRKAKRIKELEGQLKNYRELDELSKAAEIAPEAMNIAVGLLDPNVEGFIAIRAYVPDSGVPEIQSAHYGEMKIEGVTIEGMPDVTPGGEAFEAQGVREL